MYFTNIKMTFNDHIIYLLLCYSELYEYIQIINTSKVINKQFKVIPYNIKCNYCTKKLKNIYPEKLLKRFDNYKLYNYPIMDIGSRRGFTGYIDFIRAKSFINNNIYRGIDIYKRPFISILYKLVEPLDYDYDYRERVITLFQRYEDSIDVWTVGGDELPSKFISRIDFDNYDPNLSSNILLNLIHNNTVSYYNCDNTLIKLSLI